MPIGGHIYTKVGPFTNGGTPPIDKTFLDGVESFLYLVNSGAVDQNIGSDASGVTFAKATSAYDSTVVTGTTAGNATLWEFLRIGSLGGLNALYLHFAGYKNATSTEQKITLPVAFGSYALYLAGGIPQCHIWNGGAQVNSHVDTANGFPTPPGAGSSSGGNSAFNAFSFGQLTAAFNQIGLGVSQSQTYTGGVFLIGI